MCLFLAHREAFFNQNADMQDISHHGYIQMQIQFRNGDCDKMSNRYQPKVKMTLKRDYQTCRYSERLRSGVRCKMQIMTLPTKRQKKVQSYKQDAEIMNIDKE